MISANDGSVRRFVGGFRNGQREAVHRRMYAAMRAPRLPHPTMLSDSLNTATFNYKNIVYVMDRVRLLDHRQHTAVEIEALVPQDETLYQKVVAMCANKHAANTQQFYRFDHVRVFGGLANGKKIAVQQGSMIYAHRVMRDRWGRDVGDWKLAPCAKIYRTDYALSSVLLSGTFNQHPTELFGWVPEGDTLANRLIARLT